MLARVSIVLGLLACSVAAPVQVDVEAIASQRITELQSQYQRNLLSAVENRTLGCTAQKIRRRKEWSALSSEEKQTFIASIHCLNTLPAQTPLSHASGVRTRYDDFIVTHIDQTPFVHVSGLFLPFHRHFTHLFETALRSECGYTGPLPYWDWTRSWTDPRAAAVFDGSDLSLGGNGRAIPNGTTRTSKIIDIPGGLTKEIPPATGGGCVESGPFREGLFEIRLGPVAFEPKGPEGGRGYNPRCLTRDLSPEFSKGTRPTAVTALVDGCAASYACVNKEMDMPGGVPGGVHASGHWQVGLDALDVFASPSDPVFWLHHAQIDRVWTLWQGQDIAARTYQVWGTGTAANEPPTPNVTLDTMVDFGILSPKKSIRELVSSVDGDFCYLYE